MKKIQITMIMVTMMMVTMMMVTMMMVTMMMVIPCWAVWVIYWGRGRLGCLAGRDWRRFGEERTFRRTGICSEIKVFGLSL